MRKRIFYITSILFMTGILLSQQVRSQYYEQLIGFGNNKDFCKISYTMESTGKGEYTLSSRIKWLDKKGNQTKDPGICMALGFEISPKQSVSITNLKNSSSFTAGKGLINYSLKVLNDRREIQILVYPEICDASANRKEIVNAIPAKVSFVIPANILSPQHFSPDQLPDIVMVNETFVDEDKNNLINAGETTSIVFDIPNMGVGTAHDVEIHMSISKKLKGLEFPEVTKVGNIAPGDTAHVRIPVKAGKNLLTDIAEFKIEAREKNGFHAFPLFMKIETLEYFPPDVFLADHEFTAGGEEKIKMNYPIRLKVIIQNRGKGEARDYKVQFTFSNEFCINLTDKPDGIFPLPVLQPGDYQILDYMFLITRAYRESNIPVKVSITEGFKTIVDTVLVVGLDERLPERITSIFADKPAEPAVRIMSFTSAVDRNIPKNEQVNSNRFALIIGNEDYARYQRGLEIEANVIFAKNDARVFRDYAVNTLGVPEPNTYLLLDATAGMMQQKIDLISKRAALLDGEAEIIFYYAGHGYPDEASKVPYLIPVDVTANDLSSAIKLSDLTQRLSQSGVSKVVIFLDACFSGGARQKDLLASRGIRIKPHQGDIPDNVLLISAASATQSALPYHDEYHGLFTFYLLKNLQETAGETTYGDLFDYLSRMVPRESLRINEKEQEPEVKAGMGIIDDWRGWELIK